MVTGGEHEAQHWDRLVGWGRQRIAWLVTGAVAITIGPFLAYHYFTQPERVFGAKQLDCPAYRITWAPSKFSDSGTTISGCGKTVQGFCGADSCRAESGFDAVQNAVTF